MAAATQYAARFDFVDLVQRGLTTTLQCPVYRDGQLQAPASGTVTIYDETGTAVVSAAAVTVASQIATYDLTGATTTSLDLARGWRIEWVLTMGDGVAHTFRNEAGLVRCAPFPILAEPALYGRVRALNPAGRAPLTSDTSYQWAIDDAWTTIRNRLDQSDVRLELVVSPTRLRESHLLLTLAVIFQDLASRNPAHQAAADSYVRQFEAEFARASLPTDDDDDGDADETRPARRSLWAM